MTDEPVKQYRVVLWLDGLLDANRRLEIIRDKLRELDEGADGMGCAKFRKEGVRITYTPDKVGNLVAEREQARKRLEAESERIEARLHDARRVLQDAWDANAGANDPAFAYLIHRYVDGMSLPEAARSVGMTSWGAKLYPRKVATMIYDEDPARFPETREERMDGKPYGYWAF
ncbi:MAG: hypothetical protein IKE22_11440 [Atopobiaceae bacterium]|nr:hypothetical protein [Atopobiaceae bacterium]